MNAVHEDLQAAAHDGAHRRLARARPAHQQDLQTQAGHLLSVPKAELEAGSNLFRQMAHA